MIKLPYTVSDIPMTDPVSTPDDVLDELQWRWLGREYVAAETLVHEHPRVAEDASAMLDLVYAEVLLREDNGQNAVEAEYVERFPELSERIARQLQLHRALRDSEPGFDAVTVPEAPPLQQQAKSIRQAARNDVQIPGFEIQAVAGRGTCGVVYRARDEELNRIVSIKLLQGIDDPESPQEKTNTTFTHNGWGRVNQPRGHRMNRQEEDV